MLQSETPDLEGDHFQMREDARLRIHREEITQNQLASKLFMSGNALVVVEKITTAVENWLVLVDLDSLGMMRRMAVHDIDRSEIDDFLGENRLLARNFVAPVRTPVNR